ncbi:hypothetical protein QM012_003390 [Aureobasidium pullulans]|uniref:Amidase domain-containing protein n=1 Tax=Aureobasidium pullulans TaxID=5580 RepID=A0ABR0T9L2_AURPU
MVDEQLELTGVVDWDWTFEAPLPAVVQFPWFLADVPGWHNDGTSPGETFHNNRDYLVQAVRVRELSKTRSDKFSVLLASARQRQIFQSAINFRDVHKEFVSSNGEFQSRRHHDLVQAYKFRIDEVNDEFNAVLEVNPDAEDIAANLDKERDNNKLRGPLHGIPVLLEDNIYTDHRTSTSAGSYALLGSKPAREATVARKLCESGAILLGKVNLSEWANFRSGSENGNNGWSARGGQTFGAFDPGTDPDGSSSESAVSSILGLCLAAIGTETDGSIVCPAQRSSVVGVAPTTGLVARDGIIPLSSRQDTVGPLARTVKDAAHLLTAISGQSIYDDATDNIPFDSVPNYAEACEGSRLDGLRLGVPRDALKLVDSVVMNAFERALDILRSSGAVIVDNIRFAGADEWNAWTGSSRRACVQAEFKQSI